MATNLTTIEVRLIANAQKFKKDVDQAKKKTKEFAKSTTQLKDKGKIAQESIRNLAGTIAAVQGPLGPVAGRLNSIGAIFGRINLGAVAAVGAITILGVAFTKFVRAANAAERSSLKLQAIIKATGGAAQLSSRDIEIFAESVAKNTLASVQGARQAAGVLLTFKSITGQTFKDALTISQDLAEVGFGSINTAALQLGKALEEPEIGLSALRRVGVSFSKDQKDLIKVLALTGEKAKAQEIILKALKEQVGGAGEGAAGGLAGAFDTLGENINLFFERATGSIVIDTLAAALTTLSDAVGLLVPELEDFSELTGEELAMRLELAEDKLKDTKKELDEFQKSTLANVKGNFAFSTALNFVEKRLQRKILLTRRDIRALQEQQKVTNASAIAENEAVNIKNQALDKITRQQNRQIQLTNKSAEEQEALNMQFKIFDAIISKIGDNEKGQAAAKAIVENNVAVFEKNAKILNDFKKSAKEVDNIAKGIGGAFFSAGDKIADAFAKGELASLSFKDVLRSLLADIQKTIIQVLILNRVRAGIESGINKIFAPAKPTLVTPNQTIDASLGSNASGGSVQQTNVPRLVGERGPELFVPRTAGSIVPSSLTPGKMGGGGSLVINQNLNFALGVTNTVRSEIANLLPTIQQSTLSAVSNAKLRGGKFAKAFGG
jgi:hypothetical protein